MDIKSFIKKHIAIFAVTIIAIIVISIILKYNVEGEKNLPFEISKIMVISTASGKQKEDSEYRWDLELLQSNDVYIDIIKNKNYHGEEIIDKIIIDNINLETVPLKGNLSIYRPTNNTNNNQDEYKINESLEFTGDEKSDLENLKIANQGGLILLRFVNTNIGTYSSNEDTEIRHDGTILEKVGCTNEDIKFNITLDISIELKSGKNYKTTISLEMPKGNLIKEGTTNYQIRKDAIVFKRY